MSETGWFSKLFDSLASMGYKITVDAHRFEVCIEEKNTLSIGRTSEDCTTELFVQRTQSPVPGDILLLGSDHLVLAIIVLFLLIFFHVGAWERTNGWVQAKDNELNILKKFGLHRLPCIQLKLLSLDSTVQSLPDAILAGIIVSLSYQSCVTLPIPEM